MSKRAAAGATSGVAPSPGPDVTSSDGGGVPLPILLLVLIGVVMGGTQALSRSLYSQLIPRGRESEYFSFYHAMDRGTSWFGTLVFGLVILVLLIRPAGLFGRAS